MTEQARFIYSPLEKAFEKHTKTIKDRIQKQVETLKTLIPSNKELLSIKGFSQTKY